ncbi:MAG: hypothetical protein ACRD7E_28140 [Bryobacteraceae bacterium]
MNLRCKRLLFLLAIVASITAASGADKKPFSPEPASSYENKQSNNGVTIAAEAYNSEDLARTAFGNVNPYKHGILPVLVVIENTSREAIRLEHMKVEFVGPDRVGIESTPAADVPYTIGPERPKLGRPSPIPGLGRRKKKNPLAGSEIAVRAFAAKMLPPGESAHGFFYFQTGYRNGSKLYLTDLEQASTGEKLLFFEIPLDQ